MIEAKKTTILDLFSTVQDITGCDDEVVAVIDHMMRKGIVISARASTESPAAEAA
jgi:hypothetical protein